MAAIIQTHGGRLVDIMAPDPFLITIGDIAHALAHICRFAGHTKEFYSVAQHSLLASVNAPPEHALAALMHDATEAYCGDLLGPLKAAMPDYREIEAGLWDAIAWKYRLPDELPAVVKEVDLRMLATEKRDVLASSVHWDFLPASIVPFDRRITPMTSRAARTTFLRQFYYLMEARGNAKK